mgnify:CR=1 FL=1
MTSKVIAPTQPPSLNESPSEKEGKSASAGAHVPTHVCPSMKVPPKRKGNKVLTFRYLILNVPQ